MSFSIRIDVQKRLVISTFRGRFTSKDIIEGRKALKEDPAFDPAFAHILDMSRVTKVEMASSALKQLSWDKSIFNKTAIQIVVAPEKLKFEFAHLFKTHSEKERPALQVTRSIEAAYALIALSRAAKSG